MDNNLLTQAPEALERGRRFWEKGYPEAVYEYEKVIALCEENGGSPDMYYIPALYEVAEIHAALGEAEKAAYYRKKLADSN